MADDLRLTAIAAQVEVAPDRDHELRLLNIIAQVEVAPEGTLLSKATNPDPAHQDTDVSITKDLSWTGSGSPDSYDVYFGTTSPGNFQGNQTGTTFDPGTLLNNQTYYWRIDSKKDGQSDVTGDVWEFTTEASAGGTARPSICIIT